MLDTHGVHTIATLGAKVLSRYCQTSFRGGGKIMPLKNNWSKTAFHFSLVGKLNMLLTSLNSDSFSIVSDVCQCKAYVAYKMLS
jgi:hypothetical protein